MKRITSILLVTVLAGAASCFADTPTRFSSSRQTSNRNVSDSFHGNQQTTIYRNSTTFDSRNGNVRREQTTIRTETGSERPTVNNRYRTERQVQISEPRQFTAPNQGYRRDPVPVWRGQSPVAPPPACPHYIPAPPSGPRHCPPPPPAPVPPPPQKPSLIGFILSIL